MSQVLGNVGGNGMDELGFAPSKPDPDEQAVTDHSGFADCERVIALLADKGAFEVKRWAYTVSERWGKVLRARITRPGESSSGAPVVTCWTGSGPGVQMFIDFYGPDISEEPAAKK